MQTIVAGLIEKVIQRQQTDGLSNVAFAKKLNVSRQMWDGIRKGTRKPGLKVWRGIVRVYPDMAGEILTNVTGEIFGESR